MRLLTAIGIVLAIVVVVLGAYTRLVHAGLGCPDWPGCYGHLTWPDTEHEINRAEAMFPEAPVDLDKTWPEMVHRYFAGSLLLLVLALTILSWRKDPPGNIRTLSTVLLGLIILQAAFGAWTVTLKLWPQVVTAHLLGGFASLTLLWVLYLRLGGMQSLGLPSVSRDTLRTHARLALGVVILQVALGGWVTSNYAALACADFPTCYGQYWPDMDLAAGFNVFQDVGPNYLGGLLHNEARIAIHWMHRIGAILVLIVVGALAARTWASNRVLAGTMGTMLGLQLLLGILNVVWALPLTVATAHNAGGAILLLLVAAANFAPNRSVATSAELSRAY